VGNQINDFGIGISEEFATKRLRMKPTGLLKTGFIYETSMTGILLYPPARFVGDKNMVQRGFEGDVAFQSDAQK